MSRSASSVVKRTRSTGWLAKRSEQRAKDQREFDKQARRLVTWGRSR